MEAKVIWREGLSFTGTAGSGFEVALGTAYSEGGKDDGFRPMELLATGLAGCTAMDVVSILNKKKQKLTSFEVKAYMRRAAEHPKVFTQGLIEYFIGGHNIEEPAVVRAIELSATRYCSAHAMFSRLFPIEFKYHIFEEEGSGERRLAASGAYTAPNKVKQP